MSRVRFDARRDHAGVIMQQGRLLLDADWNELVAILQRRIAAGVADLSSAGRPPGIAGVAVVPRTTPDAFKVTLTGGALSIGRGRMYVDGLLAENHGLGPDVFEPILAELQGSVDTPYDKQPYSPDPDPLPTVGSHLAYLDVWNREVTHIEAPDLIEPAVGVDTTARTQTAWQVRLHPLDAAGVDCTTVDADIPGWNDVIASSGARLTVGTIEVDDADDPCELPPSGGFRGPEHQTYRVEVHDGGQPGTATFTWSRDNGSVVFPVLEVLTAGTGVRPASLGRDAVLGFSDGDWVEITDDHREFSRRPGELRRIEVHDEDGTISFTPALPAGLQLSAAAAAERHLRVRRWDQRGRVKSATGTVLVDLDLPGASGLITVPATAATQVVLEHGLVVSFSSVGPDFRAGDYWIFPARAADAVGSPIAADEPRLTAAPPLGVHHHYARLGVLTFPDGETDCRTPWPDCGCDAGCGDCTVCVTPESHASGSLTIQDAVSQVKQAGGGTVCLATGVYRLDDKGVVIDAASSIRIRGQGLRSILLTSGGAIRVQNSAFVTIENLTVFASGVMPAIALNATAAVTLDSLTLLMLGRFDRPKPAIELTGVALRTIIRDNVVVAEIGIGGSADDPVPLLTAELEVRHNLLVCRDLGIGLDRAAGHVIGNRIEANTVLRAGIAGIRLLGALLPGSGFVIADNSLVVGGSGIQAGTGGFTVRGNEISGTAESIELRGDGIAVLPSLSGLRGPTRVEANRVSDVGGRGIVALAPLSSFEITSNVVERALHGIVMDERARADSVSVVHNTVTDVGSRPTDRHDGVIGVRVVGGRRATVESNTVHGVGAAREARGRSIGIDVFACVESRVAGNSVDRVGFAESGGEDIGIAVRGRIRRCQVDGNAARRQPVEVDTDAPSAFQGLVIGADAHPDEPGSVTLGSYVLGTGALSFVIGPMIAYAALPDAPASVIVDANIIGGGAKLPAALVGVGGDVVFTSNHVHQPEETSSAAVRIVARSASVAQNRVRGGRPSGELDVDPKRIAVLGNLTSQPITNFGGPLDARWADLNPTGF
jgi:hypothetical protein